MPALNGEVDMVVHGGDLFFRSRLSPVVLELGLAPLVEVAQKGIPIYLVPGNHERSRIPRHLWTAHPNIHIFHQPETFIWKEADITVALGGFPFQRKIRRTFRQLVRETRILESEADIRLLCLHQALEGAKVGPAGYTFRDGDDVIRGSDINSGFDAILAGHIHRGQILAHDLAGRRLAAPVIYPGSVERTSFAERFELKHYVKLTFKFMAQDSVPELTYEFIPLPARPMVILEIDGSGLTLKQLTNMIRSRLSSLDPDAVVRLKIDGTLTPDSRIGLSADYLRRLAPPTMNISLDCRSTEFQAPLA
jgi:DNA repair exonuclease SbcCD nuclease subunit